MPLIDAKLTVSLDENMKEELKSEFGRLIGTLNKSETYLMVSIEGGKDLWMGGKKLDKGAYVAVSLLGDAAPELYSKMTGQFCELFAEKLGIPGDCVYVTYHPIANWGWNGSNF